MGNGPPRTPPVATSSSAKNAFPSERSNTSRANPGSGTRPRIPVNCWTSSPSSKRAEVDPFEPRQARELGDDPQERMPPRERVEPGGRDQQLVLGLHRAREIRDEIQRRCVGPMQVLDRHEDRRRRRCDRQQVANGREEPALSTLAAAWCCIACGLDLGDEAAELGTRRRGQRRRRTRRAWRSRTMSTKGAYARVPAATSTQMPRDGSDPHLRRRGSSPPSGAGVLPTPASPLMSDDSGLDRRRRARAPRTGPLARRHGRRRSDWRPDEARLRYCARAPVPNKRCRST